MKFLEFEVAPVDVGNFKLSTGRWTKVSGNVEHRVVIEIKTGDRPIGNKVRWFFDDIDRYVVFIELEDAVLARITNVIGEHRRAIRACRCICELSAQAVTVE